MAESLLGLVGKGYTLIAADTGSARSVVKFKDTEDKVYAADNNKLFGITGPTGDRVHFIEYVLANVNLYSLRNGVQLSTHAAANWTRNELATALRKGPYEVSLLVGGHDASGASLYYMDYLGNMQKVDKAAHGYCSYFCLSILDKYYKTDMNLEQGIEVLTKCLTEIQKRMVINTPSFVVKVADKDGVREILIPGMERPAIL